MLSRRPRTRPPRWVSRERRERGDTPPERAGYAILYIDAHEDDIGVVIGECGHQTGDVFAVLGVNEDDSGLL